MLFIPANYGCVTFELGAISGICSQSSTSFGKVICFKNILPHVIRVYVCVYIYNQHFMAYI
jgi:hypothetical protein